MAVVLRSLGLAVGIFLLVGLIAFVIGGVVIFGGQTTDANGITKAPTSEAISTAGLIQGLGLLVGAVLGAIGGIVYGVNRGRPANRRVPEKDDAD